MNLRWERRANDLYIGFSGTSQLAQVVHVYSTAGDDIGWLAHIRHDEELFDRYPTAEEAMTAAESAVSQP